MKKLTLTFLSLLFVLIAFAQKPVQGNLLTEFQMSIRDNGVFFPVGPTENLILPTLRFRYFISDDIAIRADLNMAVQSTEVTAQDNTNNTGNSGFSIQDMNMIGGGLGVEKHLDGNNRFSPFVGLSVNYAKSSFNSEYEDFDPNTSSYLAGSIGTSEMKSSTIIGDLYLGADYWVSSSLYVGAQIGAQYIRSNSEDGIAVNNGVQEINKGGVNAATNLYAIPNFRVGYNFHGKERSGKDSDNDGIVDELDKCPDSPAGMKVGPNGCPSIVLDVQLLAKNIYFETSSDVIKSESYSSLDKVAAILVSNPVANLIIEGHTDSQGDDKANLDLSKRRAQSVLNYLNSKGADVSHLRAKGYGSTKPIADNSTEDGRALNRRVELLLSF